MHASPGQSTKCAVLVHFRGIHREDVGPLDELQRHLFPVRYSETFYDRLFTEGHFTILAVDTAGRIVGVASARTSAEDTTASAVDGVTEGYVMTLGVDSSMRRLGLGSELLRRILLVLRAEGCSQAALHVKCLNRAACAFYQRRGFMLDPVLGHCRDHYIIDGVNYDAFRLVFPLRPSWVGWLAEKLGLAEAGLTEPPGGLGTAAILPAIRAGGGDSGPSGGCADQALAPRWAAAARDVADNDAGARRGGREEAAA